MKVLDPERAKAVTDEAVEQCEEGTTEDEKAYLRAALYEVARSRQFFTADDVWNHLNQHDGSSRLGPVMREGAKLGWMERASGESPSIRPSTHQKLQRLWRSNLYQGAPA